MLALPSECLLRILSFTGRSHHNEEGDLDGDIEYPERRDILTLYCTSTKFAWLKDLYLMVAFETEYECIYPTVNIFGKECGPCYHVASCYEESGEHLFGFSDTRGGVRAYVIMTASNHGLNIVNDKAYKYNDDTIAECTKQIYAQWSTVDPESKKWIEAELWKDRDQRQQVMLIREKIPANTYTFVLPEMEEAEEYWQKYVR